MRPNGFTLAAVSVVLLACVAPPVAAQDAPGADDGPVAPVSTTFPEGSFVDRDYAFDVQLDSGALRSPRRHAVVVGGLDVTDLMTPIPQGLRYESGVVGLPPGESELVVYAVEDDGRWREVHREPIRVRDALGFDRSALDPKVNLTLEAPLADGADPAGAPSVGQSTHDLTGQFDVGSSLLRGRFDGSARVSILGVNHRRNALRAGQLGPDAPKLDLSNFLVEARLGAPTVAFGHVAVGQQRHLVSGFASRGARLAVPIASRVDVEAGLVGATQAVGWSDPLGFTRSEHRLMVGRVGVEALSRPGALRIEASGLSGSRNPESGFNQGDLTDAEEGDGFALRLAASDGAGRLRLDAGLARSRFDNPFDPLLAQGQPIVEVRETTRNARYVEASLGVLRDVRLSDTRTVGLDLGYRHERVDPLYRSLGAFVQSDALIDEWDASATIAGLGIQASHSRARDNLDDIASILTTRTRRTAVGASLPVGPFFGSEATWLPVLSWSVDRTRQAGEGLPLDGGFSESHVPDQVSLAHGATAQWIFGSVSLGYRLSIATQDNRQEGRDDADFSSRVHGVMLAIPVRPGLTLDASLDLERAENEEVGDIQRTRRVALGASWEPWSQSRLAVSFSVTRASDDAGLRESTDTILESRWSTAVPGLSPVDGRAFVRFGRISRDAVDSEFGIDQQTSQWSVNSGLSASLF